MFTQFRAKVTGAVACLGMYSFSVTQIQEMASKLDFIEVKN